jgi:hypothetical protein
LTDGLTFKASPVLEILYSTDGKTVKISDEAEVYVFQGNKDVTPKLTLGAPPALMFTGTAKFRTSKMSEADVSINIEVTPEGDQLVDVDVINDEDGGDFEGMNDITEEDIADTFKEPSQDEMLDMGIYSDVTAAIKAGIIGPDVPVNPERIMAYWQEVRVHKWDKEILGKNVRIKLADHPENIIMLEELPGKPVKRTVRAAHTILTPRELGDEWLAQNVWMKAKFSSSMDYDRALKALTKAIETTSDAFGKRSPNWDFKKWGGMKAFLREGTRNFLEVEPSDYEPMDVEGKDFMVHSTWTKFGSYSPRSDFESQDPSYSKYASTSPAGARKLYKILKADPTQLKSVTWDDFDKWLKKNKISYDIQFSVWR